VPGFCFGGFSTRSSSLPSSSFSYSSWFLVSAHPFVSTALLSTIHRSYSLPNSRLSVRQAREEGKKRNPGKRRDYLWMKLRVYMRLGGEGSGDQQAEAKIRADETGKDDSGEPGVCHHVLLGAFERA